MSLRYAYSSRPVYAPTTPEQASLDQYREAVEPLRKVVMVAGPAVLGFFAGVGWIETLRSSQRAISSSVSRVVVAVT